MQVDNAGDKLTRPDNEEGDSPMVKRGRKGKGKRTEIKQEFSQIGFRHQRKWGKRKEKKGLFFKEEASIGCRLRSSLDCHGERGKKEERRGERSWRV